MGSPKSMTYVRSPNDIPNEPHFVILEFSFYTPHTGWENESGYSASKSVLPMLWVTTSEDLWREEVTAREKKNDVGNRYVAYYVSSVAQIKTDVVIEINETV